MEILALYSVCLLLYVAQGPPVLHYFILFWFLDHFEISLPQGVGGQQAKKSISEVSSQPCQCYEHHGKGNSNTFLFKSCHTDKETYLLSLHVLCILYSGDAI